MTTYEIESKAQGEILAKYRYDWSDFVAIMGALGSGKTIETCQKVFDAMCNQEPVDGVRKSRFLAIRNTYSDLMGTTIKDWLELFREFGKYTGGGIEPPTHRLKFELEDGTIVQSELIFLALDRADAVKKLRGYQLTGVWCNELKELDKAIVDMALARCGRYPANPTWYGLLGDSNAPDVDHWLYKLAEIEKPTGFSFYKQPGGVIRQGLQANGRVNWVVNPNAENLQNLPPDYYLKNMRGKSDDWIAVNLANEYGFVIDGKPVYPDYNDNLHCMPFDWIPNVPIYRGWDFGIASCVAMQYTPKGRLIIGKEWVATKTTGIDKFADHVLNECADLRSQGYEFIDIGDPAGQQRSQQKDEVTCFNILYDKGIMVEAGKQDLTARLEGVRHFLGLLIEGRPAFILHPDCKELRKGFQGGYQYRRMQVTGEKYTDKPDKNKYSHPQDCFLAGTKVATKCGDKNIEDIKIGDYVKTPFGDKKVTWSGIRSNHAKLWRLELSNGKYITCTPEHKFYVNGCWVRADGVQYGNTLTQDKALSWVEKANIKFKTLMDLITTSSQMDILKPTTSLAESTCTGRYGRTTMALYPKESSYITRTAIKATTIYRTLKQWIMQSIQVTMQKNYMSYDQRLWEGELLRQGNVQSCGTLQKKESNGTLNMASRYGKKEKNSGLSAYSAVKNTKFTRNTKKRDIVQQNVNRKREGKVGLIMFKDIALYANRLFQSINTQKPKHAVTVVASKPLKETATVYDISVKDAYCFYAEGVLTHNCVQYVASFIRSHYGVVDDEDEEDYNDYGISSVGGY